MQRGVQQGARRIAGPRPFAQRIEPGRTRIVFGQSLLHRRPPVRRVFSERFAPAADRPRRRGLVHATPLGHVRPGSALFEAREDHRLNHGEQIVSIGQEETRQQRHRVVAGVADPAFDQHAIDLCHR